MHAQARLVQLEEKHGLTLPFLFKYDLLELISEERQAMIDGFERHLAKNREEVRP